MNTFRMFKKIMGVCVAVMGLLCLALGLLNCKPACSPAEMAALTAEFDKAANDIIESGACEQYSTLYECPLYRDVVADFAEKYSDVCGSGN